jgi:predicted Zn-dependent protease with MMP-like domain
MRRLPPHLRQKQKWQLRLDIAEQEVADARAALPRPVFKTIRDLPVTYQPRPDPPQVDDGIEPDTLGLFLGPSLREGESADPVPAQIILFLENIHDYARGSEATYRREVRRTYLHEIGHFLGLDEQDLEDRLLD